MSGVMPRVLAVEDEAAIGELLSISLTAAGFAVEVATTAEDALKSINAVLPEVVLIDWMLPGMSGTEVCKNIRLRSNVPVIMVTARDSGVRRSMPATPSKPPECVSTRRW